MESYKVTIAFTIVLLLTMATFEAAAVEVESVGAIPPTPMQSCAKALGVSVALAAMVSLLAWFF
ncbi:hypothetical protein CsatB_001956 [Cannabis sativa]